MDESHSTSHPTQGSNSPPALGEVKLAEGGDLFKLPHELREMIYEYYFSDEHQEPSPASPSTEEDRSTLRLKLPLLQANKLIQADALPSFYKFHIFRIRFPYRRLTNHDKLQSFLASDVRQIKRIEVLNWIDVDDDETSTASSMVPDFQGFIDVFPNLRLLILHFVHSGQPVRRLYLETFRLLAQIWERLDYMEIFMFQYKDDSEKTLDILQVIAPRSRWIEACSEDASEEGSDWKRVLWTLDCSATSKAPESRASGIEDHSEEV